VNAAMSGSVINHIVSTAPAACHRISFARLGVTESMGLRELYERAGRLALHLSDLGVGPGDRIGILAPNTLEWVLLDIAALRIKAVTAGFEPSKFESGGTLLTRYNLKFLFTDQRLDAPGIRPMSEVRRLADQPHPAEVPAPVTYGPNDITTIKFTSGSTGEPKGLAATVASSDSSMRAVQEMFAHGPDDNLFIFLPLSLLQQRYWIYSALRFGHDVTVSTYEAAFAALRRTQPTVVMAVPAFYETAKKHVEAEAGRAGPGVPALDAARQTARRMFGDRIRYLWTGSAPASAGTLRFFNAVGMPIYEGYGLNEACIVTKNHPGAHREGSVGRTLPGKQVMLDSDGVISVRSDHPVNWRYEYAAAGESERMFGHDGIVRTGDLGYLDDEGFLFIRGRADDVIVLDNGRKVIVRPIEEHMKISPAIEECVLFCPTQTFLVAVVSSSRASADEAAIAEQLARTNAAFGRDEQIRKVVVAHEQFSIENEMLTSQFKPRRRRIFDAYRSEISNNQGGIHAG
jgi:long-chain acyl-CoA synthetase